MTEDLFIRITPGKHPVVAHVAKKSYPNEALCGRVLDPEPVKPKGRIKCTACQTTLRNQRTNEESK